MKRNMKKTIDQGHKIIEQHERFDMTLSEFEELVQGSYSGAKNYNDVLYKAIITAFRAGVAIGFRIRSKG
ncbi:MAG: hypothetical protein IJ210_10295 [Clostridia bacterium]|nr:hypothetical protein [Clostridia bacterium]